jgi:hypothetical protein
MSRYGEALVLWLGKECQAFHVVPKAAGGEQEEVVGGRHVVVLFYRMCARAYSMLHTWAGERKSVIIRALLLLDTITILPVVCCCYETCARVRRVLQFCGGCCEALPRHVVGEAPPLQRAQSTLMQLHKCAPARKTGLWPHMACLHRQQHMKLMFALQANSNKPGPAHGSALHVHMTQHQ